MIRYLFFLLFVLFGCAVPTSPVRQLPLSVSNGQFDDLWSPLLIAAGTWNAAFGRTLIYVPATQANIVLEPMAFRVMGEQPNVVALNETRWTSYGTREGTIVLRDDLVASHNLAWQIAVLTHELGHALGLNHEPDPTSVMYYAVRSGATISAESINTLHEQLNQYYEN